MSNIIDSIQLSGTVYTLSAQTEGGGVPESTFTAYTAATDERISQDEEVTAAGLNALNDAIQEKQDQLSAGTNITIVDNVISAEGGGKAIEAGRGISVTTGETADTVSFNLPISAGTTNLDNITCCGSNTTRGQYAVSFGNNNTAKGSASLTFGRNCLTNSYDNVAGGFGVTTKGNQASSFGQYTKTENEAEHSVGRYNVSNKANGTFGNSGNTLFSVGNGTADNARHNAFEIRQNGDIYLTKDGQDVKLQDQLGGSSITVDTALDSGSTNPVENRVIYNKFDEVEQVTAAGLNALNDKFDGLKLKKLSQTEYNNLQTKDNNTLYIIVN